MSHNSFQKRNTENEIKIKKMEKTIEKFNVAFFISFEINLNIHKNLIYVSYLFRTFILLFINFYLNKDLNNFEHAIENLSNSNFNFKQEREKIIQMNDTELNIFLKKEETPFDLKITKEVFFKEIKNISETKFINKLKDLKNFSNHINHGKKSLNEIISYMINVNENEIKEITVYVIIISFIMINKLKNSFQKEVINENLKIVINSIIIRNKNEEYQNYKLFLNQNTDLKINDNFMYEFNDLKKFLESVKENLKKKKK